MGGAVIKPPVGEKFADGDWFPSRGAKSKRDLTLDPEWGEGEPIYIYLAVEDTGRGLSDEEKRHLFQRFAVSEFVLGLTSG